MTVTSPNQPQAKQRQAKQRQDNRQLRQPAKFQDPHRTATGEARAHVTLGALSTLWFNTGTLCNIECANCYIKSSPRNDDLVYLSPDDVSPFLAECLAMTPRPAEIGFTGGEPFMNPHACDLIEMALVRGFKVLVLTNAMRPMMRPRVQQALKRIHAAYGDRLTLRISLDHHTGTLHDAERGAGSWDQAWNGLRWLRDNAFSITVAGRLCWDEAEEAARAAYARLFAREGLKIAADDRAQLVLFPEMDTARDTPEITTSCWQTLGRRPQGLMCANSRMVIKRKGAATPVVVSCTLLPDDAQFELGRSLAAARRVVYLNHPHCSRFCVLGGAACSG